MDLTTRMKPKTMAELLPELNGFISRDALQSLTAKKQPRPTIAKTQTTEKVRPMTVAEMRADFLVLKVRSPRPPGQAFPSSKKKTWNSSVKLDSKTISHTANGQMKHNPAKKMLNFHTKPKAVTNTRTTMAPASPKFNKPEFRAKKSLALQARNNVRISGISQIAETPVMVKPMMSRKTLANKENYHRLPNKLATPTVIKHDRLISILPDTPLSNNSWKSNGDASFLQNEREIIAIAEEATEEHISEMNPPISRPFKDYRSVQEFSNNISDLENSALYNDNTIMCFDKPSNSKEDNKREESVIVSLCDLLNKATVTNSDKISTEIDDLLEIKKKTDHNIKLIESSICALYKMKDSHLETLKYVSKLIDDKKVLNNDNTTDNSNKTLNGDVNILVESSQAKETVTVKEIEKMSTVIKSPCSVIRSCPKSPSYTIPKKSVCFRKNVFCKSMPNISNDMSTPLKASMGNKAVSVYLKMKEQMNFLNTPIPKPHPVCWPEKPTVSSHHLKKQLDKLYRES